MNIHHLDAATGTPTVTLYGPVDPTLVAPGLPDDRRAILRKRVPCAPCNRIACDRLDRMRAITPAGGPEAAGRFI